MARFGPEIEIDPTAYVHETALLYGRVHIGPEASVWPHVVVRSEVYEVVVGRRSNIQDFVMIHVGNGMGTHVGEDCSITHHVTLHGCRIGDRTLVGINATIMDGAVIGANSIVAGHAIVSEGSVFPENSVIAGVPAKLVAERDNGAGNAMNAQFYAQNAKNYAKGVHRMSEAQLKAIAGG